MSNRQLEEQAEYRRDQWLARTLGVEVDQLCDLDLNIEEITGNDDAFYGYRAIIGPDADEELVQKHFSHSRAIHLGFLPDEDDDRDRAGQ